MAAGDGDTYPPSNGRAPIRVMIVDDDPNIRRMLRRLLSRAVDIEVVAEEATGPDGIAAAEQLLPDIVMMDMNMPGMSGAEATDLLVQAVPTARVIALTSADDDESIGQMIRAGASGYLLKTADPETIHRGVIDVARGHGALSPEVAAVVLRDVVELYRAERRRADALEDLERMKREFINIVSHELRTPLTVIKGGLQTIRRRGERLAPEQRDLFFDSNERNVNRLDRTIRQILTISGIQRGRGAGGRGTFDVAGVVKQAVAAAGYADASGGRITVNVPNVTAVGPAAHVAEVLEAVIDNAVRFTAGAVRVSTEVDEVRIQIVVADDGPGMKADLVERVLSEPFTQGSDSLTREHEGLGLSLYVANQLMTSIGGDLAIASNEDNGTVVTLSLPLAAEQTDV